MLKSILPVAFLVLALVAAKGQEVVFYVDTIYAQADAAVVVPVKCQGFQDMAGFQFSMQWDHGHLQFDTVGMLGLPNFSFANFGTTQQADGRLSVIWYNDFAAGNHTLPDGAVVFVLQFWVEPGCAQTSVLEFTNTPTEQIAFSLNNTDLVQIPTDYWSGAMFSYCSMTIADIAVTAPPCAGDLLGRIELDLQEGIPPYQISWSNGSTGSVLENLAAGQYTFTVTDDIGNVLIDSVLVPGGMSVSISLGPDIVSCDGSAELTATSPDNFQVFQWFDANGLLATTNLPEYEVAASGTYIVSAANALDCVATDTVEVVFPGAVNAQITGSQAAVCEGDTIVLQVTGIGDIVWISGTEFLSSVSDFAPFAFPDLPTEFMAIVSNDCGADTVALFIDLVPPVTIPSRDTCIVMGIGLRLFAEGGSQYLWSGPNITSGHDTLPNPLVMPEETTLYTVEITDESGCKAIGTTLVEVLTNSLVGLPRINTLTPNGDGKNDFLVFEGLEKFNTYKLTVFNRWGNIVYQQLNYANDWGGTVNGKPLPAGIYYYVLSNSVSQIKNSLTIIRE